MNKINKLLKLKILLLVFLGLSYTSMGQIDLSDTTALVIAHWKLNETQYYKINEKHEANEDERIIFSKKSSYDVKVKVIDSTAAGYILEWTRSNYKSIEYDALDQALNEITADIPFWILTDEFGSSVQALNWEDVGSEIKSRGEVLKKEYFEYPERIKKINRFIRRTTTKDLFEANLILDVQQLLAYHGAKYKFDERIDYKEKIPNNFGGDPFDANSTLIMDQVNLSQGTFIIRSSQRINPQQLTAVTYDYLSSLNMVGAEMPTFEEFHEVTKLVWGGAEIHGPSGWVIFSEETKHTQHDKVITAEERLIELKRISN